MRSLLIATSLMLAGCSGGPSTPRLGPAPTPVDFTETTGSVATSADARWWSSFRDPLLDQLIEEGAKGNLDIQIAMTRIKSARADITVAGAGGLPAISFDASHVKRRETGEMKEIAGDVDTSLYSVSAEWLIDVFGETRAQVRSAKAMRDAEIEGMSVARLLIMSDIASGYIDGRYYQELYAISERMIASRRRTLKLTRVMAEQGVASDLDVSRAQEAVEAVEAELPIHDANFRRQSNRLATLMGRPAGSITPVLEPRRGQPMPAYDPAVGVPADLLRNRPDIRRAEREFAAAVADIAYARAQLYPTITLSGSITPSYISTNLKSGNLTTWQFGPSLRLPIFEGGRLRANVKIAVATAEEKQLAWRAAILKAVEEVENALVVYNREDVAMKTLQSRVKNVSRSVRLSTVAFGEGMLSLIEILDAERQLLDAQVRLAAARRNLALNFVALNISVGRGLAGPGRVGVACANDCAPARSQ